MTSTDFFHRDVATPLSAPPSPESFALQLQRAIDSRVRAVHMVNVAAGARRDLLLELPENFSNLNVSNLELDGIENQLPSSFRAFEGRAIVPESREALLCAMLDAAMRNLVITNESLMDMASTMVMQLVGNPGKLVSGNDLAQMMGVSEEAVRQRLRAGKLIAILTAGRERGRGFPIFQAWSGIAGAPLEQILKAMGYNDPGKAVDAADAFQFFIGRNDLLSNFTPVEVLTGACVSHPADTEAAEFFAKPHQERLEFVTSVARTLFEAHDS